MTVSVYDEILDEEQPPDTTQPAEPTSVYDSLLDARDQNRETRLRASVIDASKTTPDRAAEAQRLSELTGMPRPLIERNFDHYVKRTQVDGVPYGEIMRQSPALAEWLENPDHAAVAADDLPQLGMLEWLMTGPQRAVTQTRNMVLVGQLRTKSMTQRLTQEEEDLLNAARFHMEAGGDPAAGGRHWTEKLFRHVVAGGAGYGFGQVPSMMSSVLRRGIPMGVTTGTAAAWSGVGALPAFAGGMAAGGAWGAIEFGVMLEQGLAYDEFLGERDELGQPLDPDVARAAAMFAGGLAGGFEAVTFGVLGKSALGVLPPAVRAQFTRGAVKQALQSPTVRAALKDVALAYSANLVAEGATEAVQRGIVVLTDEIVKGQSGQPFRRRTGGDIAFEMADEFVEGLSAFALPLAVGPAFRMARAGRRAQAATQNEEFFRALGTGVSDSKTMERAPQAVRELLAKATADGPVEFVYAPVDTFTTYWQEKGLDPAEVARELTGDPNALAEAQRDGTDLVIKTADYATKIAGTEHHAFFQNELRLGDPDAFNVREAKAWEAEQTEVTEAELAEIQQAAGVRDDLTRKLVAAGVPRGTADTYVALHDAVFGQVADVLEVDAAERYQRYGLEVRGPGDEVVVPAGGIEAGTLAQTALAEAPTRYPVASDVVAGLRVRRDVPNLSSIAATFDLDTYEVLDGVREVPMAEFGPAASFLYAADDMQRAHALAEEVKASGELNPVIVVVDRDGPYLLEGAHRMVALQELGVTHVPAVVVLDQATGTLELREDEGTQVNASGESAASTEALSRQEGMSARGEQFVVYDRAGRARPLLGPEAVDYQVRPGETFGVQGPEGFRVLDDAGGRPPVSLFQRKPAAPKPPPATGFAAAPVRVTGERAELSTRVPSGASARVRADVLRADLDAIRESPVLLAKLAARLRTDPIMTREQRRLRDPEKVLEAFIGNAVENLRWLWDAFPADVRDRAQQWYDGARRIAEGMAEEFGLFDEQAAAILASLSPQMDWFKNVDLARRVLTVAREADLTDPVFDDTLLTQFDAAARDNTRAFAKGIRSRAGDAAAESYIARRDAELAQDLALFSGQRWSELATPALAGRLGQAKLLRALDEVQHPRSYPIILPEGQTGALQTTKAGKPATIAWGPYKAIDNALAIRRDASLETIHTRLGDKHKVRSFYNNIIAPDSALAVTVDTHAVAAALLRPLGGESLEVRYSMGGVDDVASGLSGAYAVYAEAYYRLAAELGVLPRQLQSVTWEAVRALFQPEQRRSSLPPQIQGEWTSYSKGEITKAALLERIENAAGGFRPPDWVDQRAGVAADEGRLPAGDVLAGGAAVAVPGGRAGRDPAVGAGAVAGAPGGLGVSRGARGALAAGPDRVLAEVTLPAALDAVFTAIREPDSGATINVQTGESLSRDFVVSVADFEYKVPASALTEAHFVHYLEKWAETLTLPGVYLGLWHNANDGMVYFDHSVIVTTAADAQRVARENLQLAYFDAAAGQSVDVMTEGERRAAKRERLPRRRIHADREAHLRSVSTLDRQSDERGGARADPGGARREVSAATEGVEAGGAVLFQRPQARPVDIVRRGAAGYTAARGLPGLIEGHYVPVDTARAQAIAAAYAALPAVDDAPATVAAYAALVDEIQAQWDYAEDVMGITFEAWTQEGQPYATSAEMRDDVASHQHLWFFTGGDPHPFLGTPDASGLTPNDKFRAIHDLFGHAAEDYQFGPRGEENAWLHHSQMFTPEAQRALTTETRGQNSWVNFGPHAALPVTERPFAEQKAALLPEEFSDWQGVLEGAGQTLAQGEGAPLGSITFGADRQFTIRLFETANLSTFLHESAHLFFEVFGDAADEVRAKAAEARTPAQQRLLADYDAMLGELGVASRGDVAVTHHEQFARLFEAYLREGRAPSVGLREAFARMRAWLISLYRTVKHLNVELTDEVRGIFDRLLASEQALQEVEAEGRVEPMFTTAEEAGMTPAAFALYAEQAAAAGRVAREKLDARILREVRREQEATWQEQLATIRAEVEEELQAQPVYRALAAMRVGVEDEPPLKLAKKAIVERYGVARLKALPRPFIYTAKGGVDPTLVAEMFGFSSGDELLQAVTDAPPLREAVEREAGRRMTERHGDMRLDGTLVEAAQEASANATRDQVVRAEIRALRALQRANAPAVRVEREAGRERTRAVREAEREKTAAARGEVSALKARTRGARPALREGVPDQATITAAAAARLAQLRLRDIRPQTFWSASRRAARLALEHAGRQEFTAAVDSKVRELLNLAMYRQAMQAREEVAKRVERAQRLGTKAGRQMLGIAGESYVDQVAAILDRYEFAAASQQELNRRASLRAWADGLEAQGLPVELPEGLLDDARRINYQELTLEEFIGVTDGLQHIAHLARFKNKLLRDAETRNLNELAADLAANIREKFTGKPRGARARDRRLSEERTRLVESWFASHRKLSSLVRELDGFEDNGPMWQAVMREINRAGDREAELNAQVSQRFHELVEAAWPRAEKRLLYEREFIPAVGRSLSRMERVMVALNWGTEGNRDRIRTFEQWSDTQVDAVLEGLTQEDWAFVTGTWTMINEFWPEIEATEKRVTGIAPEKVPGVTVRTKFGDVPGAYFPLKYDDRISATAARHLDLEAGLAHVQASGGRAQTKRGFAKERVEGVKQPVRLDFGVISEHVQSVVHYLTHHEMLIDVGRVLAHPAIQRAIYDTQGDIVYKHMKDVLRDVAFGEQPGTHAHERVLNHLRQGATIVGLGWNLTTMLLQPLGLTQSMVRIGPTWVAKGMSRWLRDAVTMENTSAWINARSVLMTHRSQTMIREINEVRNQVTLRSGRFGGWVDEILRTVTLDVVTQKGIMDSFFWGIQQTQRVADIPTWLGAYEKAMASGVDETTAIALSDQAVLDSQSGGQIKDLATVQRGGPLLKIWTNFYSFFNAALNLTIESTKRTSFRSPHQVGRLAVDYMLLWILPATMGYFLREAFRPDDDPDGWFEGVVRENLGYVLGFMVGLREFGGAVQGFYGYEGPAGIRGFSAFGKLLRQVEQGEVDEAALRAFIESAGIVFHFPAGQVQRTLRGATALLEGRTKNPSALITGPPRKK